MKKILFCWIFCSTWVFAQQPKTPPAKKPSVPIIKDTPKPNVPRVDDPADSDLLPTNTGNTQTTPPAKSKAKVPIIKDGPKTNVPPVSAPPPSGNKPKTNVPIIEDGPKTNVPRINDADGDLLPVEPKKGKTTKVPANSKANVPRLDEPDPNDLLDVTFPAPRPTVPNAGKRVFDEIGLTGSFTFNKKISFLVKSPEGVLSTYFYLNTQNGYAMMDWKALKSMIQEQPEGEMTQVLTPASHFYQYVKSSEGNFSMKMGNNIDGPVMQNMISEEGSKKFFQTFKRTGNQTSGTKFKGVEYRGKDDEGRDMSVWLSDPRDILIDTKYTYDLVGFFGLGFIASSSGRTYMVTGLQGSGASIFMTDIVNASASFSGSGYKPMGDMMAAAMGKAKQSAQENTKQAQQEINEEEDPTLRAAKQRQAQAYEKMMKEAGSSAEKFAKTSDLQDLPLINAAKDEKTIGNYYDLMIAGFDESIREHEISAAEAKKIDNSKAYSRSICLRSCVMLERTRQERLREEHLGIVRRYKNNEDKQQEELDKFAERSAKGIKPCNCD
jgi:hypothetical protein